MAEIWYVWSILTKNEILKNVLKVFEETLKILKIKKCLYTVNVTLWYQPHGLTLYTLSKLNSGRN